MANERLYTLSIMTNDGWVVTLVADKPMTLGDAIVDSIIVQPYEDYVVGKKIPLSAHRTIYRLNKQGESITEELHQ